MDISGVGLRGLRAALFSALVVLLSAGSHVLMSRVPLPPALVGGSFAAVFAIAYALAGRERGLGPIAGLLVPLELAADTVFTSGQDLCYGPAGGPVSGPLRAMGLADLCGGAPWAVRSPGSAGAPPTRPRCWPRRDRGRPGCCWARTSRSGCSPRCGCGTGSGRSAGC